MLWFLHVVSYDIWFYISHRLLHTPILYPIHSIHHEKRVPNWLDTYHGHWFESPFQSIGFLFPLIIYEIDPVQVIIAVLICQIKGLMRHDGRTAYIDGAHHMRHHLYSNCNYGEEWIDRLCGTNHVNIQETSPSP